MSVTFTLLVRLLSAPQIMTSQSLLSHVRLSNYAKLHFPHEIKSNHKDANVCTATGRVPAAATTPGRAGERGEL